MEAGKKKSRWAGKEHWAKSSRCISCYVMFIQDHEKYLSMVTFSYVIYFDIAVDINKWYLLILISPPNVYRSWMVKSTNGIHPCSPLLKPHTFPETNPNEIKYYRFPFLWIKHHWICLKMCSKIQLDSFNVREDCSCVFFIASDFLVLY